LENRRRGGGGDLTPETPLGEREREETERERDLTPETPLASII
jgi:hypothetical protein